MFAFSDKFNRIDGHCLSLRLIQRHPGDDEMIPFYYYNMVRKSDSAVVGKISIRISHNFHSYYNGHIGYEVFEEYRGHGYACEASQMVLNVARFHGMTHLLLTCDESNIASRRTIGKLGATLVETCHAPKEYFGWYEGMEKQCIYCLTL